MALKINWRLWPIPLFMIGIFSSGCGTPSSKAALSAGSAASAPDAEILTTIPFTLHDNRLLVNVFLNGQGPFVMIFDTGGSNTLTPEVQRILDLKSQGEEFVGGAGEKPVYSTSVHLKNLRVGDFQLNDQKFMVINLNPIRRAFRFPHLDGIVGLELLQQAKVRINMDSQVIQLVSFSTPPLRPAQTLSFEILRNDPIIEGKINGQNAKILLDTGDRSNLTLFRKFAKSSRLEELFEHRESMLTGMGLGGPIRGKLASVQKVDLGPTEVNDVLARLPLTKSGYFYSSDISASIGMGMLKSFNMEFDYKRHVLALQRRKDFQETSTFVPVSLH